MSDSGRTLRDPCEKCGIFHNGPCESVSGEPPRSEPPQYALLHTPIVRLLEMRDALIRDDVAEAYHLLYSLAEPTFTEREPWRRWEELAGSRPSAPSADLVDEALILYVNEWQDVDFLFTDGSLDAQKVCEFAAAFAAHLRGK